jgi:replicative DNA helicase
MAYTARMNAVDVIQGKVSDEEMQRLRLIEGPRRITMPLYLIGHSTQEQRHRPRLSLCAVEQGIHKLLDWYNLRPRVIFLDYLQQIEPDEGQDRRMQVFYNVHRCKDIALSCACPVVVGSQANRESYSEKWGVPPFTSSQESSNFEHTCDKMLGVWYPVKDNPNGGQLDTKTMTLDITENLLILQVMKQKIGPSGRWWPLHIEPETNSIAQMDIIRTSLY